ncbi:MAG TPA: LysR family transcriptional regulator [Caulobacteraceae bacterium]|jgi:molybdate transport system regulatory protein
MIVVGALKVKAQLFCGPWHAMGPGKADLLEAIGREGSVPAAARALGMTYRKAWMLTDRMNSAFVGPLVLTRKNGGPAKGATLTGLGREVVAEFRVLEDAVRAAAQASPYREQLVERLARPDPGQGPST